MSNWPATSSTASVFAAAVVYPADCSAEEIHVTYTFADGSVYTETKTGRNFEAGRIYRLTTEITKRDGGSLEIQGLEDSDEPVCMKYGASEAYALTAGGWIPTVEMTSAPAGWTADFDIARRSLLIAPPAEYTDGMDLENTVTIQSDDKPILSQEYYVLDFTHPEGTFVLIEGNMTSENGTIVYFDQHMRYHEKVYEEINDNEIGNVLQDMYLANGKIYFITQNGKTSSMGTTFNGDGRFVVCDAHTMKRLVARDMPFYANIDTSTGATQSSKSTLCWPQHIVVVSPEKAYIQYSTADNESHSGIRIVDLQTNIIRTSDIPGTFGVFTKTGATKARMIFSRGKVFAGRGNSVIVLDPATDAVIKTVTYENRQVKDLAKGYDGKIYAIFTGEFTGNSGMTGAASFTKPAMIVALDANGEVVSETNLPNRSNCARARLRRQCRCVRASRSRTSISSANRTSAPMKRCVTTTKPARSIGTTSRQTSMRIIRAATSSTATWAYTRRPNSYGSANRPIRRAPSMSMTYRGAMPWSFRASIRRKRVRQAWISPTVSRTNG